MTTDDIMMCVEALLNLRRSTPPKPVAKECTKPVAKECTKPVAKECTKPVVSERTERYERRNNKKMTITKEKNIPNLVEDRATRYERRCKEKANEEKRVIAENYKRNVLPVLRRLK
jgi:hypothetical protein